MADGVLRRGDASVLVRPLGDDAFDFHVRVGDQVYGMVSGLNARFGLTTMWMVFDAVRAAMAARYPQTREALAGKLSEWTLSEYDVDVERGPEHGWRLPTL